MVKEQQRSIDVSTHRTKKEVERLEEEATQFLHKHGFAWNGESLREEEKRLKTLAKHEADTIKCPSLRVKKKK